MQRPGNLVAALLAAGLFVLASAASAEGGSSGAGEAAFAPGAGYAGLALSGLEFGYGARIEDDGSATGQLQATLFGTFAGRAAELAMEAEIASAAYGAASVTLSGTATLGAASPSSVPFVATVDSQGLVLELGGDTLPAATLVAGSIQID